MTKHSKKVGCGPISSSYKNCQRPIANLDATQSFVYVLKWRFCKWRTLIGQHFRQAFLQKDKIVRASQLWSHRSYMFPHLTSVSQFTCKVSKWVLFLMEVDKFIDISGLPERNMYGPERNRKEPLFFQICGMAIAINITVFWEMVKEDDGILKRQSLLTVRVYSHSYQKRLIFSCEKVKLFGKFVECYNLQGHPTRI